MRLVIGLGSVALVGLLVWVLVAREDPPHSPGVETLPHSPDPVVRDAESRAPRVVPRVREEGSVPSPRQGEPTEAQRAAAPYMAFSSRGAPRWQGIALELRRLGQEDLADECWSMAGWIRDQRQDVGRDDPAILQAQDDLLSRVEAWPGLDGPAREKLEPLRASIRTYAESVEALE